MFRSKQSRLLCLLFALILCFQSFGLGVSAASDNLISPDLLTWSNWSDYLDGAATLTVTQADNIYRVTSSSPDGSAYVGAVFGDSSLIAGHSYSLSFKLPGRTEVNSAFNKDYSSSVFQDHFSNCYVTVGVGYITSSGDFISPEQMLCFEINPDNYTKYFGKTLKASFIASNYSGTPVAYIGISSNNNANHSFYFSDFKLVDNDDNSAELTGIKGFLHSIRWDLVGGTCEDEDCPHSSGDNPHLSLSERMSSGFASMFDDIGNSLTSLKDSFSERVGELSTNITSLGDRISGFFSGLGDRISGFFTNLSSSIGGFFSDLKSSMSNWFSELGDKITNKFQEIGDKFTEFFEKFKPRVTINFDWQQGYVNPNTGKININNYKPGQFFEQGSGYCLITDYFEVPSGSDYYLDFIRYNSSSYVRIFKYDLSNNFISSEIPSYSNFEMYSLESGYKYIFMIRFGSDYPSDEVMNDRCNDSVLVYADEGWINALLYNFKMGIRGLFVPDEQAILDWKESLNSLLKDHLGIIYTCSELLTDTLNMAFDIIFDAPDTYEIKIPEVSFEAAGTTVPVFSAQNIDFSFMEKPVFKTLYSMYTVALYIFFGALEVKYALAVYRKVMNN